MAKAKGSEKTGGRKAGTPNKKTQAIDAMVKDKGNPVEFLLEVMSNQEQPMNVRTDAAKAVAPYTNRKMPTSVENTDMNALENATTEELEAKLKELE